jgi:hypothetical protein
MKPEEIIRVITDMGIAHNSYTKPCLDYLHQIAPEIAPLMERHRVVLRYAKVRHSSRATSGYLYLEKIGTQEDVKKWVFTLKSAGFWRPLAPSKVGNALVELYDLLHALDANPQPSQP